MSATTEGPFGSGSKKRGDKLKLRTVYRSSVPEFPVPTSPFHLSLCSYHRRNLLKFVLVYVDFSLTICEIFDKENFMEKMKNPSKWRWKGVELQGIL